MFREHRIAHGNKLSELIRRNRRQLVHGYIGQGIVHPFIFLFRIWVDTAGNKLLPLGQYLNGAVFAFYMKYRRSHLRYGLCAAKYKQSFWSHANTLRRKA